MIYMTKPIEESEEASIPQNDNRITEWRRECLVKAGWSEGWANEIASMTHFKMDLRVAEAAIRCGDESLALDLLGLIPDFNDLTANKEVNA